MKNAIPSLTLIACMLLAGCGRNQSNRPTGTTAQISVEELSRLPEFHTYKLAFPPSHQSFRSMRFVLIKRDRSLVAQHIILDSDTPSSCTNILLGLRCEQRTFSGYLEVSDSTGSRTKLPVEFTAPLIGGIRSWHGSAHWEGNRTPLAIPLATVWEAADTNYSALPDSDSHSAILAVELVK